MRGEVEVVMRLVKSVMIWLERCVLPEVGRPERRISCGCEYVTGEGARVGPTGIGRAGCGSERKVVEDGGVKWDVKNLGELHTVDMSQFAQRWLTLHGLAGSEQAKDHKS